MAELSIVETRERLFKLLVNGYLKETYESLDDALEGARDFTGIVERDQVDFKAACGEIRLIAL